MDFGEFPQGLGSVSKEKEAKKDPHGPVQGTLKAAFTTTAEAFLQHSRNLLIGISTYFRGQANEVVAQKHEKML